VAAVVVVVILLVVVVIVVDHFSVFPVRNSHSAVH
jgi:hypothetical protein